MKPAEIIQDHLKRGLVNEDGEPWQITLDPGLSEEKIAEFETKVGFPLPESVRELLRLTNGIEGGPLETVDFSSSSASVWIDEESGFGEKTIGFAADGFGNHWGYVLTGDSGDLADLGPIYYFSHDPPVFLYQSPSLSHFLNEMFKMAEAPCESLLNEVHEDRLKEVWSRNPDLIPVAEARQSSDPLIAEFAQTLPDHWKMIDLRNPAFGAGFSWGRCREFKRHDRTMIFGLDIKEPGASNWFRRLIGR
jgi:hypothetical protein